MDRNSTSTYSISNQPQQAALNRWDSVEAHLNQLEGIDTSKDSYWQAPEKRTLLAGIKNGLNLISAFGLLPSNRDDRRALANDTVQEMRDGYIKELQMDYPQADDLPLEEQESIYAQVIYDGYARVAGNPNQTEAFCGECSAIMHKAMTDAGVPPHTLRMVSFLVDTDDDSDPQDAHSVVLYSTHNISQFDSPADTNYKPFCLEDICAHIIDSKSDTVILNPWGTDKIMRFDRCATSGDVRDRLVDMLKEAHIEGDIKMVSQAKITALLDRAESESTSGSDEGGDTPMSTSDSPASSWFGNWSGISSLLPESLNPSNFFHRIINSRASTSDPQASTSTLPAFMDDFSDSAVREDTSDFENENAENRDEYASVILEKARLLPPLSGGDIIKIKEGIKEACFQSTPLLADQHTNDMISQTLCDALDKSSVFRALVAYSRNEDDGKAERLENIKYSNEYEIDQANSSFSVVAEARDGQTNIGIAPELGSQWMSSWKLSLIHETVHQLTGSNDPSTMEYGVEHYGPTELIARQIVQEMNLYIEEFGGYDAASRIQHQLDRDKGIAEDYCSRHNISRSEFLAQRWEHAQTIMQRQRELAGPSEWRAEVRAKITGASLDSNNHLAEKSVSPEQSLLERGSISGPEASLAGAREGHGLPRNASILPSERQPNSAPSFEEWDQLLSRKDYNGRESFKNRDYITLLMNMKLIVDGKINEEDALGYLNKRYSNNENEVQSLLRSARALYGESMDLAYLATLQSLLNRNTTPYFANKIAGILRRNDSIIEKMVEFIKVWKWGEAPALRGYYRNLRCQFPSETFALAFKKIINTIEERCAAEQGYVLVDKIRSKTSRYEEFMRKIKSQPAGISLDADHFHAFVRAAYTEFLKTAISDERGALIRVAKTVLYGRGLVLSKGSESNLTSEIVDCIKEISNKDKGVIEHELSLKRIDAYEKFKLSDEDIKEVKKICQSEKSKKIIRDAIEKVKGRWRAYPNGPISIDEKKVIELACKQIVPMVLKSAQIFLSQQKYIEYRTKKLDYLNFLENAPSLVKSVLDEISYGAAERSPMRTLEGRGEVIATPVTETGREATESETGRTTKDETNKEAAKIAEGEMRKEATKISEEEIKKSAAKISEEEMRKEAAKIAAKIAEEEMRKEAAKAAEEEMRKAAAKTAEEEMRKEAAKVAEEEMRKEAARTAEEEMRKAAAKTAEEEMRKEAAKVAREEVEDKLRSYTEEEVENMMKAAPSTTDLWLGDLDKVDENLTEIRLAELSRPPQGGVQIREKTRPQLLSEKGREGWKGPTLWETNNSPQR
ncbi:M85 family metallopeptidase [Ralstonia mojiangensis]|uniref:M85 family metallopeptidase n=1 Tax=Ralstonia mojiangensis TaxID=2953895 RepID=UPI0021B26AB9|nr:M85 family metallopeptidase [Ralstonia mojiangensis]MCT7328853.1 hypothetical protein [Ralstonia mojiangensis]